MFFFVYFLHSDFLQTLFLFVIVGASGEIDDSDDYEEDDEATDDEDGVDTDEEAERDDGFTVDAYEDADTDSDSDEADEIEQQNDYIDDEDDDEQKIEIKFRTSVDAYSIVRQIKNCYARNGLVNIGASDKTYTAADRSSSNVKANGDLPTTMISGILHGFSNVVKGSIKAVTSETVGKTVSN